MKSKGVVIAIICVVLALVIVFCILAKNKKNMDGKTATEYESSTMLTSNTTSDALATTEIERSEASTNTQKHTEAAQDTTTGAQTNSSATTKVPDNEDNSTTADWKSVYIEFIENEKRVKKITLTDFEYAFVSMKEFENPLLLIHDDWNMYLYYELNGTIYPAKEKSGDALALQRMDVAYTKRGNLYLEGAAGVPKAFYLCQVVFDDGFTLKYIAEGYNTPDGEVVYHDDQGNTISEYDYNLARNKVIVGAKQVEFGK